MEVYSNQKYLKYKNKYLKFKQSGGGGDCNSNNYFLYLCFNEETTNVFINRIEDFENIKISDIDSSLSLSAFKYNFGEVLSFVVAPGAHIKKSVVPIDHLYLDNKIDIMKLMSKINLLKLIQSLEEKFNKVKSSKTESHHQSEHKPEPEPQPQPQPEPQPEPQQQQQQPQSETQSSVKKSTKAVLPSNVLKKNGGAPITNIKISTVLLLKKENLGKIENMKLISHFKVDNNQMVDIPITSDNEDFVFIFKDEISSPEKPKKHNIFGRFN